MVVYFYKGSILHCNCTNVTLVVHIVINSLVMICASFELTGNDMHDKVFEYVW